MKLTLPQSDLSRALSTVLGSAESKGALPILATVLLRAADDRLTLTCSDLTLTTTATSPAYVVVPGAVCVDAKKLGEIAKSLPKGEVDISVEATGMLVRAGRRRFTMPMLSADDYPVAPSIVTTNAVEFDAETLRTILGRVGPSMSTDDTRPHLNAALLEVGGGTTRAVSTDGHRLTLADAPHAGDLRVLIPAKGATEIRKLAERGTTVTLSANERFVFARTADVELACKLVDAQFPAYQQVIPTATPRTVATVNRAVMLDAIRAVSLVSTDRTSGVRLRFGKKSATIDSENPDVGSGLDEVTVDVEGPPLAIGVNGRYLCDALGASDADEVRVEMGGELDPLVVKANGVLVVVMPTRMGA